MLGVPRPATRTQALALSLDQRHASCPGPPPSQLNLLPEAHILQVDIFNQNSRGAIEERLRHSAQKRHGSECFKPSVGHSMIQHTFGLVPSLPCKHLMPGDSAGGCYPPIQQIASSRVPNPRCTHSGL